MKRFVPFITGIVLLFGSLSARADLVISANPVVYTGTGPYIIDVFATASGSDEFVGGYNLAIDFSDPFLTLESVSYNSAFEVTLQVPAGVGTALLQATDTDSITNPFRIQRDQSRSLATIALNATGAGQAPISVLEITDNFFSPVAAISDPQFGALAVTAIPEPTSVAFLLLTGSAVVLRRRRRR